MIEHAIIHTQLWDIFVDKKVNGSNVRIIIKDASCKGSKRLRIYELKIKTK